MVGLEELSSLDFILWRRTGKLAAQASGCNQSTMSRRLGRCLQTFDLQMVRRKGEWELPSSALLQMQRELHQRCRLAGQQALRLEAFPGAGRLLVHPLLEGWIGGSFDHLGVDRPLQLLRERVIDAWLASYQPDLPDPDDPQWWVLDLVREPVRLLAAPDHPLAGVRRPSADDLRRFPSLALPPGWFPRTEAILRGQGLWQQEVPMSRYDPADWEGRCGDGVTLTYGQSLTEALQPGTVRLDWDLGLISGEALVVRRDLIDWPPIQKLAAELRRRARAVAGRFADVEALN